MTQIIQIDGNNFYIENNQGGINKVTQHPIPKKLSTIPEVELNQVVGRSTDIKAVTQLLNSSSKVVLVNGLGGIGKTTLAQAYLQTTQAEFTHIAWVNVIQNTKRAFAFDSTLVDNLHLRFDYLLKDEYFENTVFQLIINRLNQLKGNNLLIIDNANTDISEQEILNQIHLHPTWKVLVTSRQNLAGFEVYELGFLSLSEAAELFYLHYKKEKNDDLVKQLVQIIDRHTLAIEVLAKTAQAQEFELENLLKKLQDSGLQTLDTLESATYIQFPRADNTRLQKVFSFLIEIFDLATLTKYEQWILKQFTVLPAVFIPFQENEEENILSFLQLSQGKAQIQFTDALNTIVHKGWLLWDKSQDQFKMHQVLQEVIFAQLQPTLEDCKSLIDRFANLLQLDEFMGNPVHKFKWIPYTEAILKHILTIEEPTVALRNRLSILYTDMGKAMLALPLVETCIKFSIQKYGTGSKETASYWTNIGTILEELGHYEKAKYAFMTALAIDKKYMEEDNADLALGYAHLGEIYLYLSDFEAAKTNILKALDIQKRVHGATHIRTATSLAVWGNIQHNLGDLEKAEDISNTVLQLHQQILGKNHPSISIHLRNLGLVEQDLGQYDKARTHFQAAFALDMSNYGEQHPNMAINHSMLGNIDYAEGQYKRAKAKYIAALSLELDVYGQQHPKTGDRYTCLASIEHELGHTEEAIQYYLKGLEIIQATFETDHIRVADILSGIANPYRELGQLEKAKTSIKTAMAIYKKHLPEDHFLIAGTYSDLALVLQAEGQMAQAITYLEKALMVYKNLLGSEHLNVAILQMNLASAYLDIEDYVAAKKAYQVTILVYESLFENGHVDLALCWSGLGLAYRGLAIYSLAIIALEKALHIALEQVGEKHYYVPTIYSNLGAVHQETNNLEKAHDVIQKAMQLNEELLGKDHPQGALSHANFAKLLQKQGLFEQSEQAFRESLRINQLAYGEAHPFVGMGYRNLSDLFWEMGQVDLAKAWMCRALVVFEGAFEEGHDAVVYAQMRLDGKL